MLEAEYQRDPNWTTSSMKVLAARLSFKRTKVYKWFWDRVKREGGNPDQV